MAKTPYRHSIETAGHLATSPFPTAVETEEVQVTLKRIASSSFTARQTWRQFRMLPVTDGPSVSFNRWRCLRCSRTNIARTCTVWSASWGSKPAPRMHLRTVRYGCCSAAPMAACRTCDERRGNDDNGENSGPTFRRCTHRIFIPALADSAVKAGMAARKSRLPVNAVGVGGVRGRWGNRSQALGRPKRRSRSSQKHLGTDKACGQKLAQINYCRLVNPVHSTLR